MKADAIHLNGDLSTEQQALDHVEMLAQSFGFEKKDSASARLLAEEAISAFSVIIGVNCGELWVETNENDFEIHLKASAELTREERENLIELSSEKKNTPKKGIIGKLASLIDYLASDTAIGEDPFMIMSMYPEVGTYNISMVPPDIACWSMQSEEKEKKEKNMLSDIEKTLIEGFADDIIVSIAFKNIELIIKKTKKQA